MTPVPSRRTVLLGLGVAGLAAGLSGCTDGPPAGPPAPGPTTTTTTTAPTPTYQGEAASIALCAALASLTGDLLGEAATGAGQGRYGAVPGVVSGFLAGAAAQNVAHAEAWNRLLTAASLPAVDGTPVSIENAQRARLGAALAPVDLLGLAADLTDTVAATVTAALSALTGPGAIALAAGVAPVVAMQAATAGFLLGRPPTAPQDPTAGALGPDALTA